MCVPLSFLGAKGNADDSIGFSAAKAINTSSEEARTCFETSGQITPQMCLKPKSIDTVNKMATSHF